MAPRQHRPINRRRFLRLAGASSAALLFAGSCRSKPPAPSPAPGPAGGGVAVSTSGGAVKWAEFYSLLTPEQQAATGIDAARGRDWMQRVAQQFEAENRGWQVTFEPVAQDEVDQRSAYDFNANVDHDLVFATPQLMARHRKLGDLLDLGPFVASLPASERDDVAWSAVWKAAAPAGQQLGLPLVLNAHGYLYHREAFRRAGLDPDKPPQTPDELLQAGLALARPTEDTWGLGLYLGRDRAAVEGSYLPLVWHFGGDIYDEKRKAATFADEAGLKAARWVYDLIHTHKVTSPAALGLAGARIAAGATAAVAAPAPGTGGTPRELLVTPLVQGKVGQVLGFSSDWIRALQEGNLVAGCVPPGTGCKAEGAGVAVMPTTGGAACTGGWCLAIHRLSRQPEMAFRLLRVILRPENLAAYPGPGLPARLSAWQTPAYRSPFYQAWLTAARSGRPMAATPYYWELADTITAALAKILGQKADIPSTLREAQDRWNSRYSGE